MSLPNTHNILREDQAQTTTNSIAGTPLACVAVAPFNGYITNIRGVAHGSFTTNCSVAVAIILQPAAAAAPGSGTAVTGSPLILNATNSAAGTTASFVPSGANYVNEGDLIMFTPSGSTGTTIGGTFVATIARA